jgi:lysozyme
MKTYIRENEGSNIVDGRHMPYKCTAGKLTCGYGRNIEDKGISEYEATIMLDSDISDALTDLRKVFNYEEFEHLSFNRKMALTDMVFNIGRPRFLGFKKMIQAIKDKDFDKAALELMDSNYARQVPNRATRNRDLIRGG